MDPLKDARVIRALLSAIGRVATPLSPPVRLMEVCGTHTMALHRTGLSRQLLDAGVEMASGPGCPVCVTPDELHEAAIDLVSGRPKTLLATFGDMTRVPTAKGSLRSAFPASGSAVRVVYSPLEALDAAVSDPAREVIFFGAGFETTIPSIAFTVKEARRRGVGNFSVLTALWLLPPPLRALLEAGEVRVRGFLYPGHVSAIIGVAPYAFIPREFGLPGAVAGFEPADILLGIRAVLDQMTAREPGVALTYARVVRPEGNPAALALMNEVLEPADALWRGLGTIPRSGLRLRPEWAAFDAEKKFGLSIRRTGGGLPGCRCGDVLRGVIAPRDCGLFGGTCTPEAPRGPCMVSFEGACLVHYKYGAPGVRHG
jgi:hydrogenase expression/formation protein HypD